MISDRPTSYRVISAAHQNTGGAYRRFERQPLLGHRDEVLQRVSRHSVTVGVFSLAIILAFLGWAAA